jgi:hypothetical protein
VVSVTCLGTGGGTWDVYDHSASPSPACVGQNVQFQVDADTKGGSNLITTTYGNCQTTSTNLLPVDSIEWTWSLSNGGSGSGTFVTTAFSSTGTYTCTFNATAINGACTTYGTVPVTVLVGPFIVTNCIDAGTFTGVSASASPSPVCVGQAVTFTATAINSGGTFTVNGVDNNCNLINGTPTYVQGPIQWTWSIGGNSGPGSSVTTNFGATGTYTCNFTATATNCPSSPITTSASASIYVDCPSQRSTVPDGTYCNVYVPCIGETGFGGAFTYCFSFCAANWYVSEDLSQGPNNCGSGVLTGTSPALLDSSGCTPDDCIADSGNPANYVPCTDTRYQTVYIGPSLASLKACDYINTQIISVTSSGGGHGTVQTISFGKSQSCTF